MDNKILLLYRKNIVWFRLLCCWKINQSLPNILFLPKLWMKLIFLQPVCPNTKILSLNVASHRKFLLISKKRLKYSFSCFATSLYLHYFPRFFLANWGDKMSVFAVRYFYKSKFFCFLRRKIFPFELIYVFLVVKMFQFFVFFLF